MIMEAPLGSFLDTLGEELDAGAKAIQKARVRLPALQQRQHAAERSSLPLVLRCVRQDATLMHFSPCSWCVV